MEDSCDVITGYPGKRPFFRARDDPRIAPVELEGILRDRISHGIQNQFTGRVVAFTRREFIWIFKI